MNAHHAKTTSHRARLVLSMLGLAACLGLYAQNASDFESTSATQTQLLRVNHKAPVGPMADTNGNGLPDLWERQNFGQLGVDPLADPDGDGLSNAAEFAAGSNPNDPASGPAPAAPPTVPGSLIIVGHEGTSLYLQWAASEPAPDRVIKRYEVWRNGSFWARTSLDETQLVVTYAPGGSLWEYFSVRAVDNTEKASEFSSEVRAPRNTGPIYGRAQVEPRTTFATAEKIGFKGMVAKVKFYRTVSYQDHVRRLGTFDTTPIDYEDQLSHAETYNLATGQWDETVSGVRTNIVPGTSGTWRAGTGRAAELRSPTGVRLATHTNATTNLRNIFGDTPTSLSDTVADLTSDNIIRSQLTGDSYHETRTASLTLTNEYTDAVLTAQVEGFYRQGAGQRADLPWFLQNSVTVAGTTVGSLLDAMPAHLAERKTGLVNGVVSSLSLRGADYRLRAARNEAQRLRWAEVFDPADGSASQVLRVREVDVPADPAGAVTEVFTLEPPATPGGITLVQLGGNLAVQPTDTTDARLYLPDTLFVGGSQEMSLGSAVPADAFGSVRAVVTYPDTLVRLVAINPAVAANDGVAVAIAQGYTVASGTDLFNDPNWPGVGGWRLVAVGLAPGTATITLQLTTPYETQTLTRTLTIYTQPQLAVDANRDGVIATASENSSDEVTPSSAYHFWVNDDSDSGETKQADFDDVSLAAGANGRNADDDHVNGIRDLVDFFPVYLDLKKLITELPPGVNGVSYNLRHEDGAFGAVLTNKSRQRAFEYLRGAPDALALGFGPSFAQSAGDASVLKVTPTGLDLFAASSSLQASIMANDGAVILMEANRTSQKPLVLEVRKGTDVLISVQLPVGMSDVATMYHYFNIRDQAHGTPILTDNQGPNYGVSTPSAAPNDPFQAIAQRKNVVFVHGYNVNVKEAQGWAAETFKRLYWSGSRSRFYAVLWRGDDGQIELPLTSHSATPDYHRNVGHAWQQGPFLRDLLTSLSEDTVVIAHSLGNLVAQVALTYERDPASTARLRPAGRSAAVQSYFAIDAAIPLEALSDTAITVSSKALMRHPDWAEYDSQERLWPTQWYALFNGTSDARSGLTWRNIFARLDVGTNLYSSGDEVLANPISDAVPLLEPLLGGGLRAWVAQEKHKGGNGPAAPFFRPWSAGWTESKEWYVPIVPTPPAGSPQSRLRFASEVQDVPAPDGVPSSMLTIEPFFQRFQASTSDGFYPGYQGSRLHAPIGDADADDEARKLVTVAKCLAAAIPSLSYPLGSNPSTKFNRLGGNFDLNAPAFRNGWPSSRPDTNWKHSDCLNVAYTFNYHLFDKMINDGVLK